MMGAETDFRQEQRFISDFIHIDWCHSFCHFHIFRVCVCVYDLKIHKYTVNDWTTDDDCGVQ